MKPWRQGDRYEEEWLGVELELESLEVVLAVGDLDHNVLEAVLVPGDRWVLHHRVNGIVELLVLLVEEGELAPQRSLLGSTQNFGNVDLGPVKLEILLQLLSVILRVHDAASEHMGEMKRTWRHSCEVNADEKLS